MHSTTPVTPLSLADVVDLKETGDGTYLATAVDRSSGPRVFGGQLVSQALAAAGRTVPDGRVPHSLHGHFLDGANPEEPVEYTVDAVRDGRAQAIRYVRGRQGT